MRKTWNRLKSFIGQLDFAEAFKDIADDLKKASAASFMLWLLSQVQHLPLVFSALPKILGVDAAALQTSEWVSWLLLGVAIVLYLVQVALRVKIRDTQKAVARHDKDNILNSGLGIKDDAPRRSTARCASTGSGNSRNQPLPPARGKKSAAKNR